MKRYRYYSPSLVPLLKDPNGELVLFEDVQAAQESLRTSYVTLECQYARLMDSAMHLQMLLAKKNATTAKILELAQGNLTGCGTCYSILKLLASPSEAKGAMRPIERPLCQFGGSYGWCELEPGHDGPHKITRAGVLEAKGDTP